MTEPSCPVKVVISVNYSEFHNFIVLSFDPLASIFSFGWKIIELMSIVCPFNVAISSYDSIFHNLIVLSKDPLANKLSLQLNITEIRLSVWN